MKNLTNLGLNGTRTYELLVVSLELHVAAQKSATVMFLREKRNVHEDNKVSNYMA